MANWYFTIDEIILRNDWFIRLVFLRTYSTETMEIGNRRKYIIPLLKLNKKELAGFADMSRPTIQKVCRRFASWRIQFCATFRKNS